MTARLHLLKIAFTIFAVIILLRLFYWQVLNTTLLSSAARNQHSSSKKVPALRGDVVSSDGFSLVSNKPSFLLYAYLPELETPSTQVSERLASVLLDKNPFDATQAAKPIDQRQTELELSFHEKLNDPDKKWIPLAKNLSKLTKSQIEDFRISGLGFEESQTRFYPEASMSAHILGFVRNDVDGNPQGYFGLEGYYDLELRGKAGQIKQQTDAQGEPIIVGEFDKNPERSGRTLILHLNRTLQYIVRNHLDTGLQQYGAKSGEIVIMNPHSGAVLAMAALPTYDPTHLEQYDSSLYKNPIIADTYEPGSTFKVITLAAAIEDGKVTPQTICGNQCAGPVKIGPFSISTWNNQYFPGQTVREILQRSDNTGMVFVAQQLGKDAFLDYLQRFGFGQKTGIDLQEESSSFIRKNWGDIDLATSSFGQGIAVTGIQMVTALSAIANGGELVEPHVVSEVIDQRAISIKPVLRHRVISKSTADQVTDLMVSAAHSGEAQWAVLKDYQIAGKTGTAQIPIEGHYDQDKTIASFIGFAPAKNPSFVMLVKLTQPQTSPWASETAAPLWFNLAKDVLTHLKIPPDKNP